MKVGVHDYPDVRATKVFICHREGPRDSIRLLDVFPWDIYGHQGAWERAHALYRKWKKGYSDE